MSLVVLRYTLEQRFSHSFLLFPIIIYRHYPPTSRSTWNVRCASTSGNGQLQSTISPRKITDHASYLNDAFGNDGRRFAALATEDRQRYPQARLASPQQSIKGLFHKVPAVRRHIDEQLISKSPGCETHSHSEVFQINQPSKQPGWIRDPVASLVVCLFLTDMTETEDKNEVIPWTRRTWSRHWLTSPFVFIYDPHCSPRLSFSIDREFQTTCSLSSSPRNLSSSFLAHASLDLRLYSCPICPRLNPHPAHTYRKRRRNARNLRRCPRWKPTRRTNRRWSNSYMLRRPCNPTVSRWSKLLHWTAFVNQVHSIRAFMTAAAAAVMCKALHLRVSFKFQVPSHLYDWTVRRPVVRITRRKSLSTKNRQRSF